MATQQGDFSREDLANSAAEMLADTALGLFLIFIVLVAFDIFPLRIKDSAWMLSFATTVCNTMLFPLAGLLFLHLAAALATPNEPMHARRRFFSRLALLAVLGYLLLIPLIGFANWRGVRLIQARQQVDTIRINQNNQRLIKEIDAATSAKDLQLRLRNAGGPPMPDSLLDQPLPALQKQAKEILVQATGFAKLQARTPTSPEVIRAYVQSGKLALLSLICAFSFASVSWLSKKNVSLAQKLFNS
jgi:uncharacterized membrane protein (DUF485 family)